MSRRSNLQVPLFSRFSPRHPWRVLSGIVFATVVATTLAPVAESLRTARIIGRVTGEGRAPLNGARITLLPVDERPSLSELSDPDGAFTFAQVPAGRYRVQVSYESLNATSNAPMQFEAGESYTLDMPMVAPHDKDEDEDEDAGASQRSAGTSREQTPSRERDS